MSSVMQLPPPFSDNPFYHEVGKPYTRISTCIAITRVTGPVIGLTDHNSNLVVDSVIYYSDGGVSPDNTVSKADMSLDTSELISLFSANSITREQVLRWNLDNAKVRVFLVNRDDTTQTYTLKDGYLGLIGMKNSAYTMEVVGKGARLAHQVGRTYSPSCDTRLFSARCGVNEASFTQSATIASVGDDVTFTVTLSSISPSGYFNGGKVKFTTGQNINLSTEIKNDTQVNSTTRIFELFSAMPFVLTAGVTLNASSGCDKSHTTCKQKYNNIVNFQGHPHVPGGAPGGDEDDGKAKSIKA